MKSFIRNRALLRVLIMLYPYLREGRLQRKVLHHIGEWEGGWAVSMFVRKVFQEKYGITVGYGSYGGCFNTMNIPAGVTFGNYCSIARNVYVYRANHPSSHFTTHPVLYNPVFGFVDSDKLTRPKLEIGNDVWLGDHTLVLPSVKSIGNGAIIGAGSVVTKDVPPYSVVVGNPAKIIKQRFTPEQIKKLEETKWWTFQINELTSKTTDFQNALDE